MCILFLPRALADLYMQACPSAKLIGRVLVVCFTSIVVLAAGTFMVVAVDCRSTGWCIAYCALEGWLVGNIGWNYVACVLAEPAALPRQLGAGKGEFCRICKQHRGALARHCYTCGRCIERFDHHCPWIANCLGQHNRRQFVKLLAWLVISALTGVCFTWRLTLTCLSHHRALTRVPSPIARPTLAAVPRIGYAVFSAAHTVNASSAPSPSLSPMLSITQHSAISVVCGTHVARLTSFAFSLCVSVGIGMSLYLGFHLYLILTAQTSMDIVGRWMKWSAKPPKAAHQTRWRGNWERVFGKGLFPLSWMLPARSDFDSCMSLTSFFALDVPRPARINEREPCGWTACYSRHALKSYFVICVLVLLLLWSAPGIVWTRGWFGAYMGTLSVTWVLFLLTIRTDPGYVDVHLTDGGATSELSSGDIECGQGGTKCRAAPLRTLYCKEVGRYVATYDHFCTMMDTPIGEKNHFRFFWLVTFQTLIAVQTLILARKSHSVQGWLLVVFLWPFSLGFMSLAIRHACLALANMTTYECMRGSSVPYLKGTRVSKCPFTQGGFNNLRMFCFVHGIKLWYEPWKPTKWAHPKDALSQPIVATNPTLPGVHCV